MENSLMIASEQNCSSRAILVRTVGFILISFSLLSCDREISEGTFEYLEIGSNKIEVVEQLRRAGVTDSVMPFSTLSGKDSLEKISNQANLRGAYEIVIQGRESFITIKLQDDLITEVYTAPASKLSISATELGETRASAFNYLRRYLEENPDLSVDLAQDSKWVSLIQMNSETWEILERNDSWYYHENAKHSRVNLYFEEGVLNRIKYSSSPIELP